MLTQGLRIEIFLEEARKCICNLATTQVSDIAAAPQNLYLPRLLSAGPDAAGTGTGVSIATTDTITVSAISEATTCVMTVGAGEADHYQDGTKVTLSGADPVFYNGVRYIKKLTATTIGLYTDADLTTPLDSTGQTVVKAPTGVAIDTVAYSTFLLEQTNTLIATKQCPFVVNQSLMLWDPATVTAGKMTSSQVLNGKVATVEQVTDTGGAKRLKITMSQPTLFTTALPVNSLLACNTAAIVPGFSPQFVMDEVEMVLQKIIMPSGYVSTMMKSMKENGMIRYDFNAMQTYKYSMLSSDTEGTIMLPLQNSRAKAMLCCPVDASSYTPAAAIAKPQGFAFRGHSDNITEYRFTYNGKMNPDRPVPLAKVNSGLQEQQHLIELDKALAMSGITPACMQEFATSFIVPRALSLQGGSYDTRSKDFQLQVSYREATAPALNKLWHIFVSHVRSIVVKQGNLTVQV